VHETTNLRYHALIEEFEKRTGCAVLVNTSFNVRGERIVASPDDTGLTAMTDDIPRHESTR